MDDNIAFKHKGFDIEAHIVPDYDADVSWIGEFSNEPGEGAIDHHATGKWLGRSHRGERYFNPANYDMDYYIKYAKMSEAQARAEADRHAQSDYKRLVGYYTDEWSMVGVTLTVSRDGVKLAEASIWGVETDSGADNFNALVQDLLHDAMAEADEKLKLLTAFARECA
jgi:hypothetical protein